MRDGKILEVINCDLVLIGVNLVDVRGMYIVFGFVCMYVYGGGGYDFIECIEEVFCMVIVVYMKYGVISFFLIFFFFLFFEICKVVDICEKLMVEFDSLIFGLYVEGFYLNCKMVGE